MFYSHNNKVFDHHLTYLHTQKVFAGQYWDEFAITCSLVPDRARVLMLGLSLGGGIRPLFSSTKSIELTCVDNDENSVKKCRELYSECFPDLRFQSIIADAREFLNNDDQKYDAIWFDIYDAAAYSALSCDTEFFSLIQKRLTDEGVLLVNSYGLPNHFSPLAQDDVQHNFAARLKTQFGYVSSLPYRRNMTFIVSSLKPKIFPAKPHESLNAVDRFTFEFIQQKVIHQLPFNQFVQPKKLDSDQIQFVHIDKQMKQFWSALRQQINSTGFIIRKNSEFISLIQNPEHCEKIIRQLIHNNDASVFFVPILAAGESHIQELQIDWLFDWTEKNHTFLSEALQSRYKLIWLAQLWALIIHPHGRYKKYYFKFLFLIRH